MTSPAQLLDTLFRRRFWLVSLALIALVMYFVAVGVNSIIAANLAAFTVVAPRVETPVAEVGNEGDRDDQALSISELFEQPETDGEGEEEPPVEEPPVDEEPEEDEEVAALEGDCVQANISAILVGTMSEEDPAWSFGIIQDQTSNRTVLVRAGDLLGGATVTLVTRNRVYVDNDGREECLKPNATPEVASTTGEERRNRNRQQEEPPPPAEEPTEQPSEEPVASSDFSDLRAHIRRQDPTTFEIDRAAIDAALANPRQLQSQAPEFQQNYEEGRPAGIRLTSIPSGSIFSALGIRQGDVIVEVNGSRITTPQRAMELYEALQSESHVEVTVERRGRARTLTYDIR